MEVWVGYVFTNVHGREACGGMSMVGVVGGWIGAIGGQSVGRQEEWRG